MPAPSISARPPLTPDEWRRQIDDLNSQVEKWVEEEEHWFTKRYQKRFRVYENGFDAAEEVIVLTPEGRVAFEPLAPDADPDGPRPDGLLVDAVNIASLDSALLYQRDGTWHWRDPHPDVPDGENERGWDRDEFHRLLGRLLVDDRPFGRFRPNP